MAFVSEQVEKMVDRVRARGDEKSCNGTSSESTMTCCDSAIGAATKR